MCTYKESVSESRQLTINTQHSTTRNKQQSLTAAPANQQSALDNRHPTTDNKLGDLPPVNYTRQRKPTPRQLLGRKYIETRLEATTSAPALSSSTHNPPLDSICKSSCLICHKIAAETIGLQRHYISFIDNATLPFTNDDR